MDYTESERKENLIKRTTPRLVSGNDNETEIRSTEKAKPWSGAGRNGGNTKSKTKRVMVSTIEVLRWLKRMFPIETKKGVLKQDEDTRSGCLVDFPDRSYS